MKKKFKDSEVLSGNFLKQLFFIMKLTLFFLITSVLGLFATESYSQMTRITLDLKSVTVKDALKAIENESEFFFIYNNELINVDRKIDINVKDQKISDILSKLFDGENVEITVIDRKIVLAPAFMGEQQPGKKIAGKVTDSSGATLPGVSVVVKGTSIGIITDMDGNYSLSNIPENAILQFSFVGMKSQEVSVAGKTILNVKLAEDAIGIEEVVAVGYGTQKKENMTGAVSTVKMRNILGDRPVTNPILAIQGIIPGLEVSSNSGQPGASSLDYNIRGATSINGGSPLILLDNVPVSSENINPQDIESISVLKDAASSSIYGARAAFGVILITTKKSKKEQLIKLEYSSTLSFSSPTDLIEKASTYDYVNALSSWGVNPFWTGQDIPKWKEFLTEYKSNPNLYPEGYATFNGLKYPLADTDVLGEFLNSNGFSQIHNASFSGGTTKSAYRVSVGYSDEDGIITLSNDSYKKYNISSYLNSDLTSNLTVSLNILYNNSIKKSPIGDYNSAISYGPYIPASGDYVLADGTKVPYDTPANSERLRVAPKTVGNNLRLFGKLDYNPLKGFTITGEYTFEQNNADLITGNNQVQTVNPNTLVLSIPNPVNTFYRKSNSKYGYNAVNIYAKYVKSINNHNLSALAGFNNESKSSESFWAKKTDLINVDLPSISTATGTLTGGDSFGEWSVMGYFARLNYNFKEKYLFEANGRYDGSSKFAQGRRFGFFPSFSAGWDISKEAFLQNVKPISQLKLRGSWGENGNQNTIDLYPAIPGMPSMNASWVNPQTKLTYITLGAPGLVSSDFTWEKVQSANVGIDLRLFKNRLSTTFDLFSRKTIGMLAPGSEIPQVLGAASPLQNVADLLSKGWEFEMSWKDKINNFSYNLGFSISDNQSEITKFNNPAGLISQYYIGQKIGEIWGYVTDGFYTVDDFAAGTLNSTLMGGTLKPGIPAFKGRNPNPGDIKFKDLNNDGVIFSGNNTLSDPGDKKVIGNKGRRYQYGIFGNAEYKYFDFSFVLNGVGKKEVYLDNSTIFPYEDQFAIVYKNQLDYWTPENTTAFLPRNYPIGGVNYDISRSPQTKYLLDGSYLRIKNISLGYTLPKRFLSKVKIDQLRLFVSGENLFTLNHLPKGIDTELILQGTNGGVYPILKNYSFGINLSF